MHTNGTDLDAVFSSARRQSVPYGPPETGHPGASAAGHTGSIITSRGPQSMLPKLLSKPSEAEYTAMHDLLKTLHLRGTHSNKQGYYRTFTGNNEVQHIL